jgi:wobble nucleotide-excising tRNase
MELVMEEELLRTIKELLKETKRLILEQNERIDNFEKLIKTMRKEY